MTVDAFQHFLYMAQGGKHSSYLAKLQGILVAHSWYSHVFCSLENTNIKKKNKVILST